MKLSFRAFRNGVFNATTSIISSSIGLFAPATAARYHARRNLFLSIRKRGWGGYNAAERGGSNQNWHPLNRTADAALRLDYQRALARARDLVRNNEYVAGAIETFAANVIGQGITPQATVGKARGQKLDEAFNTQAQSLFDDWAQWSGFYEQQELIVKHLVVDGESLGHFVIDNNGIRKPRMPPGGKEYVWLMKASRRTRNKAGRQYSRRKQKTSC